MCVSYFDVVLSMLKENIYSKLCYFFLTIVVENKIFNCLLKDIKRFSCLTNSSNEFQTFAANLPFSLTQCCPKQQSQAERCPEKP